jgi:hypothetical protein
MVCNGTTKGLTNSEIIDFNSLQPIEVSFQLVKTRLDQEGGIRMFLLVERLLTDEQVRCWQCVRQQRSLLARESLLKGVGDLKSMSVLSKRLFKV